MEVRVHRGTDSRGTAHDGVRSVFTWPGSEGLILSPGTLRVWRVGDEKPGKESEKGEPERRGRKIFCFG